LFVEETEKEGVRELFAVEVKLLLTRSVCCLVYGQRKESCNVGVPTIIIIIIIINSKAMKSSYWLF